MVGATFNPDGLERILAIRRTKDAWVYLFDRSGMNVARYPARGISEQRDWLKRYSQMEPAFRVKEMATTILSAR